MTPEILITYYFTALIICFFTLIGAFFSFWITKKHGIIDAFWGIGIVLSIVNITKFNASMAHWMIHAMVILWGGRLSSFIFFTRILTPHVDRRYTKMIKKSPTFLMVKQIFIQAPLQALVVLTAYPLMYSPNIPIVWGVIGVTIYGIGLFGEALVDYQLYKFKQKSNGICTHGLWAYSRHPNYFFECLIWLGISITFIGQPQFKISFLGPLSIFIVMYFITGPYTERCSIERHGNLYLNYQKRTHYFLPWKKRAV